MGGAQYACVSTCLCVCTCRRIFILSLVGENTRHEACLWTMARFTWKLSLVPHGLVVGLHSDCPLALYKLKSSLYLQRF